MAASPESRGVGGSMLVFHRTWAPPPVALDGHADLEISLTHDGTGTRFVGDSVEAFGRGDLCLIGANLPHIWRSEGRVTNTVIRFDQTFLDRALAFPELACLRALTASARGGLQFGSRTRVEGAAQIERLLGEPPGSWRGPRLMLEILARFARSTEGRRLAGPAYAPPSDPAADARLATILRLVEDRMEDGLCQREAAERAEMSSASFSRFF